MGKTDLRTIILSDLLKRKETGILQSEIESRFGFSRAHVSETLALLVSEGKVEEKREGRLLKRIWLSEFFPYPVKGVLRISLLASSEYVPFLSSAIAVCRSNNISVRLRTMKSSTDVMDSLLSGSAEIAIAPFYSQIIYSIVTRNIKLLSSMASGGSSIFVNNESESRIFGTSDTSTMILLSRSYMGSLKKDVEIFGNPHTAIDAFESGKFKHIAIWEPFCTILRKKGAYDEILTYRQVLGENPCCVSSFRADIPEEMRNLFREIAEDYRRQIANGVTPSGLEEAIDLLATEINVKAELVSKSLESYNFSADVGRETVMRYMDFLKIPISMNRIDDMLFWCH